MALRRSRITLRSLSLLAAFAAAAAPGLGEERPLDALSKEFGVQDQTRTMLSAFAFAPGTDAGNGAIAKSGSLGRYCWTCPIFGFGAHYYAPLDLPSGTIIDSIGVSNQTDTDAIMGFTIWERHDDGSLYLVYNFRFPAHAGVWQ